LIGKASTRSSRSAFGKSCSPNFGYYWKNSEKGEKILLVLFALFNAKKERELSEKVIGEVYSRYRQSLPTLRSRSMILQTNGKYRLFSPVFAEWILGELTDVSQPADSSLNEWLGEYEKGAVTKGFDRVRETIQRVNPRYWKMFGNIFLEAKNRHIIKDLLEMLKQAF